MTNQAKRGALLSALLLLTSGCSDEGAADTGTHARGAIEAFGRPGETSFMAEYSSKLDDESCEARDAVSECVLLRCEDEVQTLEDAGEVTVDGEALDIAEDNSYSLVVAEELDPGAELEMSASGSSVVPKHTGSVLIPERAELTSEFADVVESTEDLVITWTPAQADRVIFRATFDAYSIECATTGTAGQITVAASLLVALPKELPGPYSLTNENLVEKSVSGWRVWFRAHNVLAEGTIEIAVPL